VIIFHSSFEQRRSQADFQERERRLGLISGLGIRMSMEDDYHGSVEVVTPVRSDQRRARRGDLKG
jgi:hypothetical protein